MIKRLHVVVYFIIEKIYINKPFSADNNLFTKIVDDIKKTITIYL